MAQLLDFKQERRYVLTVTATDSGGRSDTAMVHINITDANNYAPVFENAPYTASVSNTLLINIHISYHSTPYPFLTKLLFILQRNR